MADAATDLDIVLNGSPAELKRWFRTSGLVIDGGATAFAGLQSFQSASNMIVSVDPLLHRFASLAAYLSKDVGGSPIGVVLHAEVASVVASPWFGSSGSYSTDVGLGLTARFRNWVSELVAVSVTPPVEIIALQPQSHGQWHQIPGHAVLYVAAASLDRFSSEQGQESQRYKLERIQSLLGLRLGEMTQLLEVSPQGMRKWHAGGSMAPERSTRVDDLYNLAIWLASHIRPEALPAFMRRDIPALGGQTPLEWLRSRRWHELRRVYERIFRLVTRRQAKRMLECVVPLANYVPG